MNTVDKLIKAGRDPLEALFVPPAPDVAEWLEQDRNEKIDKAIKKELSTWTPEMRERLRQIANAAPRGKE